ncbi:PREDICTED: mitochondrial import receptor subunit TOM40-1-like [Camelina sativa]|uniref:Mitochondrial import receptor subunit TOM40-1-like n=1 Tax=Camelina sativa TaxID=90675 RepID=A0ABM0YIL1_CAMSA|nr:PREDICTED: mitochondrial import receptor subunit TOM40-1-like [Camelina sativa]
MTITAAMADLLPPSTTKQADEKDVSLNPGYFKGFNVNYSPAFFNKNFDISSSMGPKHYAFRASYLFSKVVFFKGIVTHDRLTASVIAPIMSEQLFMLSFIDRVTPRLYLAGYVSSSGGHFFWTRVPQETSVGYAARYETDKMVASAKVESSGDVLMTYVHKISKKVSLATDFVYNCFSRDVGASVGYDYKYRLSRVQGKIDSNGVVYAHLKRKLNVGLRGLLTASLDLKNMNQRLGLRLPYG